MDLEFPLVFVQIDEEGFVLINEVRIKDDSLSEEILAHLEFAPNGALVSRYKGEAVAVEAFDQPLVALDVSVLSGQWKIHLRYSAEMKFELSALCLDEWDRFHGETTKGIPFVLSREAQENFFNLLDSFDDDSITFQGTHHMIPAYFAEDSAVEVSKYWTDIYHQESNPGWNLGEPAEALKDMLPRLKLPKSRVLVVGCGEGHDAAFFAKSGHVVTAIDFSEEAVARAIKNYGDLPGLTFLQKDVFNLGAEFQRAFDIVFEHTCYCAINPTKRNLLIKVWRNVLHDQGQLMGVFFTMYKRKGPPYGGSEWELRHRLQNYFQFIFWGRWQKSLPSRQGKELFILAHKKSIF